ncbi:MAG: arginine--tRNA ligase [Candidatus Melainabacteria bacterium]|nr:arginine--tRNA ligase [Candidatus Melainabacteria bacterium]
MSYKQKIQAEIKKALNSLAKDIIIERTKQKEHGDVATNIAMILAKEQKRSPLEIANEIRRKIKQDKNLIANIEVAKPGFINFFVGDNALAESLAEVLKIKNDFGYSKKKLKEKILIEYVSANPTGDLHIGHGRQAVIGSSLANLLEASGHEISNEFYINDYGEQIANFSYTCFAVYRKLKGEHVEWKEDFYPEEGILPYVENCCRGEIASPLQIGQMVKDLILKSQKELLASCKVNFERWFSEAVLHESKAVEETLKKLKEKNYTYEHEDAIWFKAKDFGDVRDRVLIRSDKRPTYLTSDIAYHIDKFKRGYDRLITIWGADHHGQEISLKGGLKALGYDENKLEIVFVQMVSLKQEGKEVKMSKRAGTVVTIKEVLDEVGLDAFRYFLVETHPNNRMIFNIDLAKKQDKDNPVYYVQYAHARCCSVFRQLKDLKLTISELDFVPELLLNLFKTEKQEYDATKDIVLKILDFPEEVVLASVNRSPNRIANYLKDLATSFHQFYTVCRVISKNINLTKARLGLVQAVKITINNGLKILGISAPEAM